MDSCKTQQRRKKIPLSKEFPVPNLDGEEVVVGIHESGIELHEGLNVSLSRNYCSNCKKKIHSFVRVNKETKEAEIHVTCKSEDCECKCRTHYACKLCGYLHPYDQKCDRIDPMPPINPKNEEEFRKILDEWKKFQDSKTEELVPTDAS